MKRGTLWRSSSGATVTLERVDGERVYFRRGDGELMRLAIVAFRRVYREVAA